MNYFLIIAAAIVALLGWFKPQKTPLWIKGIVALLLVTVAVVQVVKERQRSSKEGTLKFTGVLEPEIEGTVHAPQKKKLEIGWTVDRRGYCLEFENSLSELFPTARPANKRFLQVLESMAFQYDLIDQRLEVSFLLRDNTGLVVASIERNEWKIAPPPRTYDRNYSKDMLEVVNDKGNVVLQVRALQDTIQLNGVLYGENGHGMAVHPHPSHPGAIQMVMLGPDTSPQSNLKPIFKYPSELHLGQIQNEDFRNR